MESILIKQGEECKLEQISDCAIEALRPNDFRCNTCGNASMLLAEEQSNFKDGVAYPISQGSTSEGDWALNAAGAYDEAKWSNDMSSCDLCGTPQEIQPTCAYADKCGTSTIPPLCEWESGGDDVGGIIGGVIGGVVVCCVLGGAGWWFNRRRAATNAQQQQHDKHSSMEQGQQVRRQHPDNSRTHGAHVAAAGASVALGVGAMNYDEVTAAVMSMDSPNLSALQIPPEAAQIGQSVLDSTFVLEAGEGLLKGVLAAGKVYIALFTAG